MFKFFLTFSCGTLENPFKKFVGKFCLQECIEAKMRERWFTLGRLSEKTTPQYIKL